MGTTEYSEYTEAEQVRTKLDLTEQVNSSDSTIYPFSVYSVYSEYSVVSHFPFQGKTREQGDRGWRILLQSVLDPAARVQIHARTFGKRSN